MLCFIVRGFDESTCYVRVFICLNFCLDVVRAGHTGYMGEQYDQHRMDALSKSAVMVVWTTLVVEKW